MNYNVYIVKCADGVYYTGMTNDLERRLKLHNSGNGARYLRGRGLVKLVYSKKYRSHGRALSAEMHIKKLNRRRKMELIRIHKSNVPPSVLAKQNNVSLKLSDGVTSKRLERHG